MARLEEQLAGGGLGVDFGGGDEGGGGFMDMFSTGAAAAGKSKGGAMAALTAGAFTINPILGLGVGALGMLGKGITAWRASRDKRKAEEKADKRYAERLKMNQDRFEMDFRQAERSYGFDRATFAEKLKQQNYLNTEKKEEKNFKRTQDSSSRLMAMLNRDQGLKQQFLSIWSK